MLERTAYKDRQASEVKHQSQIGQNERETVEHKAKVHDGLWEKEHRRRIEELTLAKAVPVGFLRLGQPPSGGGFIEGPER